MRFAVHSDMKKVITLAAVVGISALAHATTINAPSSLVGSDVLDGNNAYSWGISIAVPTGETITSAEVDFTAVTLNVANSSGHGYLYLDLLNSQKTGVTTAYDGDAAGDYWATQYSGNNITSLGSTYFASVNTTKNIDVILDSTELAALNSYAAAGTFNLGIDPDCHYSVGGLCFTYTCTPKTNGVPDAPTTVALLALSLGCLEVCRRQLAPAKAKA